MFQSASLRKPHAEAHPRMERLPGHATTRWDRSAAVGECDRQWSGVFSATLPVVSSPAVLRHLPTQDRAAHDYYWQETGFALLICSSLSMWCDIPRSRRSRPRDLLRYRQEFLKMTVH